jgi:hypothetical protein
MARRTNLDRFPDARDIGAPSGDDLVAEGV